MEILQCRTLNRKKVAILATDGFEQVEQTERKKSLEDAGATVSRALCESHSERD
jgi:putative intracellular protease/amidase